MKSIFRLRRLWLLLTFPAAFALMALAAKGSFAEWYAENIYPALLLFGNSISAFAPISIAEFVFFFFLVLFAAALVRFLIRIIRGKGKRLETAGRFVVNLLCVGGVLFFLFTIDCGINYHRSTFAETCGLPMKESQKSELVTLCKTLASDSNRLRTQTDTGKQSVMQLRDRIFSKNANTARVSVNSLAKDYPLLKPGYSAPKSVYASKLMSYFNITGMFFPFTFEANVNTDVPEYTIPFTMCHELSHLRGFMREDEANFIAYLACEKSNNKDFRYSGSAMAFTYASNALYAADAKAADKIFAGLSDGVRRDLQFNSDYWNRFKGPAADAGNKVNNSYLKANNQKDGVQSYGRMVDLLLALQRAGKLK